MDELDRKALYWSLKMSRMAVYNQTFMGKDPVQLREGIDPQAALSHKYFLDQSNTVLLALGCKLGIDD